MKRFLVMVAAISIAMANGAAVDAGGTTLEAVEPVSPEEHCSALVIDNEGAGIFGANFDHTWTDEGLVFVNKRGVVKSSTNGGVGTGRAYWTSRYASVTFNLVGFGYPWGGMNEAGLSISTMSLAETQQPPPDDRPVLDNGEWVQYILDTCATVDDVIATDADVRIVTVDHYLVGDRFGDAATIEFLGGRMVVHSGPDLPVAALTNNTYDDLITVWEWLRDGGSYSGLTSSFRRFCLVADRVVGFQPTTVAEAIAYAFDTLHMVRGERFSSSPTNWRLVFDTENLRAYFLTIRNNKVRWVDLNSQQLRCGTPVQMMDIHDGGGGDVAGEMIDYNHALNRVHFERFLSTWGINLPPESITWLLNHMEGFECVIRHRNSSRRVAP